MKLLPNKAASEAKVITFDFAPELATGATLSGTPTVAKAVISGAADASGLTLGSPAIVSGRYVQCLASAGVEGAAYKLTALCGATNGETHEIVARLGIGPTDWPT